MKRTKTLALESIIPNDEEGRLEALHRYKILYTPEEKTFDEIASLLAETFDVAFGFVSFVDKDKVFFKSKSGNYSQREVNRNNSLCSLTILKKDVSVFENVTTSEIIPDYAGFSPPEGLKFYAGFPLITDQGFAIGTICIADTQPRSFSEKEKKLLQQFARLTMKEVEYRRAMLEQTEVLNNSLASSIALSKKYEAESQAFNLYRKAPVAIALYKGRDLVMTFANETALEIAGITEEAFGKKLIDIVPEVESQGYIDILTRVFDTGIPFRANESPITLIVKGEPKNLFFNFIYEPYFDSKGNIEGVLIFGLDITEEIQNRKAIEVSERKFRNVLEQSPYPILILKGEELVLEVANPPLLKLWNIDNSHIGLPFLEILPEMKEQGFWDLLQGVYKRGEEHHGYETPAYFIRNGRKQLHYFNFVYHPYRENDGTISGVLVLATDVTEQVITRQKAEKVEANFRAMVLQAPIGICLCNPENLEIEVANDSFSTLFGISGSQIPGKPLKKAVPFLNAYQQAFTDAIQSGITAYHKEQKINISLSGKPELVYIDLVVEPIIIDDKVSQVMLMVVDVKDKVLAREQVESMEARTRLAVESAELGTFDVNLLTNDLYENKRLHEIFDLPKGAGRDAFVKAIHPDDLAIREEAYKRAFETGILEYEARVIHRDGSLHWIKAKGSVLFDEKRTPVRLHGVLLDITEQKRFTDELTRQVEQRTQELTSMNQELQKRNEELDQFAYVASHDLQEPLRKIIIFNNIIHEKFQAAPDMQVYLDKISNAALRMNGLVKSLLDYSRISSSTSRFEVTDLNLIIKNVLSDYEILIEEKNAGIDYSELPVIDSIPLQMNQLFFNLIGNALKFTRPGVPPSLHVSASKLSQEEIVKRQLTERPGGYIKLQFADNGIGFNPKYAEKIFTIFQRLNERSQFGGYGIGLALCKKITDNHGGIIFAEGKSREGAVFTVILPSKQ